MHRNKLHNIKFGQSGQTLIETIVAIFVLTTALTTGLGLAIYALSSSGVSQTEIIAANLAREGVDVVRMMRDTNWLVGDEEGGSAALQACADLPGSALCYPEAFTGPEFDISDPGSYILVFDSIGGDWSLQNGNSNYNLYLQSDGSYTHIENGASQFARKITLELNTASPYTIQNPELIVRSIVGWIGKSCSAITDEDPSTTNCNIVVEEHLTNWKDYQ